MVGPAEPQTKAGGDLWKAINTPHFITGKEVFEAILAIEAEAAQRAAPRAEGLDDHRADSQTTIRCVCGYFHDVSLFQHHATQEADGLLSEWLDYFAQTGAADFPRNHLFARTRARLSRPSDERVPETCGYFDAVDSRACRLPKGHYPETPHD